jgi:hypothetical protein
MSPVTIAQQIVSEFRENMEQGACADLSGDFDGGGGDAGVGTSGVVGAVAEATDGECLFLIPVYYLLLYK